jgi:AraC-like DNA-binding protein
VGRGRTLEPYVVEKNEELPKAENIESKDEDQKISSDEGKVVTEEWKERVLTTVRNGKLYQNPQLTLTELSQSLGLHPVWVSRIINAGFEMNFNDFINKLRVEEVQAQLQKKEGRSYTIMSLAYDAGFNSKATFNRAFKKFTGKNPKDFLE